MARSKTIRRGIGWTMVAVFVASVVTWTVTRDRVSREIRIATALPGGLYYKFAEALAPHIRRETGSDVILLETEGTGENRDHLTNGTAELAILQLAAVSMRGLAAVAPLYRDVVLVVARRDRGIGTIRDLTRRNIAVGLPNSGMRASAVELLVHYGINVGPPQVLERYFLDLLEDESLDAAIITTGLMNPDLKHLLAGGLFKIIPINEAAAFCLMHPAFQPVEIPSGLYGHGPALPAEPVTTVATMAFLAAADSASGALVASTLEALYASDITATLPTLIPLADASKWQETTIHPAARDYFDPYRGIDTLASFMESLAAGKELLFALGAGLYLLFDLYRRLKDRERARAVLVVKERLDALLADTASIARAQIETTDPHQLKEFLDEITRIKLRALDELTHEDLRGDRMFLIFLMQCGNVINNIQAKIALSRSPRI